MLVSGEVEIALAAARARKDRSDDQTESFEVHFFVVFVSGVRALQRDTLRYCVRMIWQAAAESFRTTATLRKKAEKAAHRGRGRKDVQLEKRET